MCLYDCWTSHRGHKGKGFKEWPRCTVLYFVCRLDSLLLPWTKLPNNWTSYQPWGMGASRAQERSVTQKKILFPSVFVKCVQYHVVGNVPYSSLSVQLLLWMNEGYDNTAPWTGGVGGGMHIVGVWSFPFQNKRSLWGEWTSNRLWQKTTTKAQISRDLVDRTKKKKGCRM